MESYGNVIDEEWVNLGSMFSCDQDDSNHGLFSSDHGFNLETLIFCPSANESNSSTSPIDDHILSYHPSDHHLTSNCYNYFSQESSSSATESPPQSCHDMFQFCSSKAHMDNASDDQSNNLCMAEEGSNYLLLAQIFSDDAMEELLCLKQDDDQVVLVKGEKENSASQPPMTVADRDKETPVKRKYGRLEEASTGKINENPKKKTRVARDNKSKKNLPPKKNQKMMRVISSNEDDGEEGDYKNEKDSTNNGRGINVQSSSCCSSEGDSNACQDVDGGASNQLSVKTRAGRGAATDPQSIYARKRRERINERLKTLQTLVPNGTKVDISTMLEEAVHYVKFLQLQIKLLSSDDKWMYAPIAYNGMDMGLYQNL